MYTTAPMNTNVAVNTLTRIPAIWVAVSSRSSSTPNRPTQ
jgi:hypothetical protein